MSIMFSESENLKRFIQEMNRTADEAASAVRKETEDTIQSVLSQARDLARQEVAAAQFTELDKLIEKNNAALSEAQRQETQTLLLRRKKIEDEVFAEAEKRVKDFVKSEKYREFLLSSAKGFGKIFSEKPIFEIRPEDAGLSELLLPFCSEIRENKNIHLGGIRALSADGSTAADDTLDSRLQSCRQDFYEKSGLSVNFS